MAPRLSIIIPVYNVERYLRECLDSMLAQSFTEWEAICVDDGSTDSSLSILKEYAARDNRFVVIHKENGGQGSARNVGLDRARGEYVLFVDSDDALCEDAISKLLSQAAKTNVDILIFGAGVIREDGAAFGDSNQDAYLKVPEDVIGRVMSGSQMFSALMKRKAFFVCPYLYLMKRAALPLDLRFPEGVIHEDNHYAPIALLTADRTMAIDLKPYLRRVRAGSTMTALGQALRHARGYKIARKDLLRYLPVSKVPAEARGAYREYVAQLQIAVFTWSGHNRLAKCYALYQAFRREGCCYVIRRIVKYLTTGR